jgi:hypothetical protein
MSGTVSVLDLVMQAIREEIPHVNFQADKLKEARGNQYFILKVKDHTIGYVNGKEKIRIDSPRLDRRVLICNPAQVPVAVEFVKQYVKEG